MYSLSTSLTHLVLFLQDVATCVDVMFFMSFSQDLTCLMLLMMTVSGFLCALNMKTYQVSIYCSVK